MTIPTSLLSSEPKGGWVKSRLSEYWFEIRVNGHRILRAVTDLVRSSDNRVVEERITNAAELPHQWPMIAGESVTELWTSAAGNDFGLVAGKVQNLRIAANCLNGTVVPAGKTLSFWKVVGRPTRKRGFVDGRELREGCLVASVGGGLCQLSNAIYCAAQDAGLEIVERHAHSRIVPGSLAELGRDATVFWNYVDLRIRHKYDFVLQATLSHDWLKVQIRTKGGDGIDTARSPKPARTIIVNHVTARESAHDCVACEQIACVNHIQVSAPMSRKAYLLDDVWPEYDKWIESRIAPGDLALVPLNGVRRGRRNYGWSILRNHEIKYVEHRWLTFCRSLISRLFSTQGAIRQRHQLASNTAFAKAYMREVPPDIKHLVVPLSLLADLWTLGVFGGRTYDVLVNRTPLQMLHENLDRAKRLHPHSTTLGDFRADQDFVSAEISALNAANTVVTPHCAVAKYVTEHSAAHVELIPWQQMGAPVPRKSKPMSPKVLFPASGLGRKGAFELRAVCQRMGVPICALGDAQETPGFWEGCQISRVQTSNMFDDISCVVLPAFVEQRPGILLAALAVGIPVICSPECGIPADWPNVVLVEAGATDDLLLALELHC
jgi:hypothetical protein